MGVARRYVDGAGDRLVDQYYEPLYRFALSLARAEDAACDLTQETFYLWAAKGHQLRDRTKVKSWLFTTLHREFLRHRRHHDRFRSEEPEVLEAELPAVPDGVADEVDGGAAMAALQRVEEVFRVPLALFYLEDFSYKEIAEALELPIGTVMSRLSRGKAQLRALLTTGVARGGGAAGSEPPGAVVTELPEIIPFRRSANS